ncbi:hypothetical protein ACFLXN_02075 [Chloroflexota bacterium]
MSSLKKALFWEKPIQKVSRRIARALPFMSNTSVTRNVADKLGTTEEGAHMAMIGLTTFLTPGLFKIAWTPFALIELIKAYKKSGFEGATEAGKWYLKSSTAVIATKEGTTTAIKVIRSAIKAS